MTLYEKSINSFLTNAINTFCTSAPTPVLTVADVLPASSAPVLSHIMNKSASDDNFQYVYHVNVDSFSHNLSHPILPNSAAHDRVFPIHVNNATTSEIVIPNTTTKLVYYKPQPLTIDSILTRIITEIRSKLLSEGLLTAEKQKPSLLVVDSLSTIASHVEYTQLSNFIQTLTKIPTISGIILLIHTDSLSSEFSMNNISQAQEPSNPANLLDLISSLSTTFFQILPPPPQTPPPPTALQSVSLQSKLKETPVVYDGQCILSARVVHTHSNGKLTTELVSLWTYQNTLSLRSSYYSQRHLTTAKSDKNIGSDEGQDLLATLGDLPFKLSLTAQQQKSRANVELQYAHVGGQLPAGQPQQKTNNSVLGGGVLLNNQGISQSWTPYNGKFEAESEEEEDEV